MDAAKADLDAYHITRDIEHNCRQCNLDEAFYLFQDWISKNPWTEGRDHMSYYRDVTGPDNRKYEHITKFDPNKRPGVFGSKEYALFHGWKVGTHAADSGWTGRKCVLCTSMDPFLEPLNVVPERSVWI